MNLPTSCKLIYCPKGRADEYARWALNLYRGCKGGCLYCFGPRTLRMKPAEFHGSPRIRSAGFLTQLEKEARRCQEAGLKGRVLLCFTCDPYQEPLNSQHGLARKAIEILHAAGLNVQILTKFGQASMGDIDLFTPDDAYAATLTFSDSPIGVSMSKQWEPYTDSPDSRLAALRAFYAIGVPTWASLEPVVSPENSLQVIEQSYPYTTVFKAGTLNYHPHAKTIDWIDYARKVVEVLHQTGRPFYIKDDLAKHMGLARGYWGGGPFCTCGVGDTTQVEKHDPLCLYTEVCRRL